MSHKRTILSLSLTISLIYSMLQRKNKKKTFLSLSGLGKNTPCYASAPEGRKQTPVPGFNLTWRNRPYLSQHHHSLSWGSITPFHQEYTSYCVGPTWVLLGVNVRKYTSETGCIFPSLFFSSPKTCPRGFNSHAYADLPTIF